MNNVSQTLGPQPHADAVFAYIYPFDEQAHEARLLGREQLVPDAIEVCQGFMDCLSRNACRTDRPGDDLGRSHQLADLLDHGLVDRARRHAARLASTFDRYSITSDRIIRELALIGFANIGDFVVVQADGSLVVDFGTATREQMASLKSIEIDERMVDGAATGVRKIKISMSDKRQALMDLAKIARMLPADRHEHSGPGGGPIAFDANVKEEHKINIEAMAPEEREQLRETLLTALAAKAV
jgi:hypothetical protein